MPKKNAMRAENVDDKIEKLLFILNTPETGCKFWKSQESHSHIMGIRPVNRLCLEIIGQDGFTPYEKKTEEKLFKVFYIHILNKKYDEPLPKEEIENKKEIEKNGYIYLKHHDLFYIFEYVRNNR